IVQGLGQVVLRSRVLRIGLYERVERGAGLIRQSGAEIEECLLSLQIEIERIVIDQRLQQIRGLLPLIFLLINIDELQNGRAECRIDLYGALEILLRLIPATELCQNLGVVVVECPLIRS